MSCTKTIQAQVVTPVPTVIFNGSPRWESIGAVSRILCNVTISGASASGMTLHYVVDGIPNLDVGMRDGTYDVVVSNALATNVNRSVTIQEANAC